MSLLTDTSLNKKAITYCINALLGIYILKVLWEFYQSIVKAMDLSSESFTWFLGEYLVNYQGGFVRRGLTGEILFHLYNILHIKPQPVVAAICIFFFVFVVVFFIREFSKQKICWWILPLNFLLANTDIIRKDYLFAVSFILILFCYRSKWKYCLKAIAINFISIFTLLSHEVFFFYCIPLICLLILTDNSQCTNKILKALVFAPIIICLVFIVLNHGDISTARSIASSWSDILGIDSARLMPYNPFLDNYAGSIGAIAWTTDYHLNITTAINNSSGPLGIPGFIIRTLGLFLLIFFTLNYLALFSEIDKKKRFFFARVFFFQFLTMIPLFFFVSCDIQRCCFYWMTSSFIAFFLIPEHMTNKLFPRQFTIIIDKTHAFLTEIIALKRWLVILLLFFIFVPYMGNSFEYYINSVLFQIYRVFSVMI